MQARNNDLGCQHEPPLSCTAGSFVYYVPIEVLCIVVAVSGADATLMRLDTKAVVKAQLVDLAVKAEAVAAFAPKMDAIEKVGWTTCGCACPDVRRETDECGLRRLLPETTQEKRRTG
jgi:hypothetical protein